MLANMHLLRLALAVSCLAFVSIEVGAQTLPERFHGVWLVEEGEPRACKRTDWRSEAHQDTHINVSAKQIEYYESRCRVTAMRTSQGGDPKSRPVVLTLACSGEGMTWRETGIWQVQRIRGHMMLITVSTRSNFALVYQQCP